MRRPALALAVILLMLAWMLTSPPPVRAGNRPAPARAPDTMAARVAACTGCHGAAGRGVDNVYFPRLAGKPAGYLYNQLLAFRDGHRKYVPMNYLLAQLPDAYLYQMAQHFAAQDTLGRAAPPALVAPQVLAAGRRLGMEGAPARRIPACASCHGADLAGREPGIPGLLGLRADYIGAQLGAWRYGVRTAAAPDCMQLIAASLGEDDVAAVSAWLASLPVVSSRPAIRGASALPQPCGSQGVTPPELP